LKENHEPYVEADAGTMHQRAGNSDRGGGRRRQNRTEQCSTAFGFAACRQKAKYEVGAELGSSPEVARGWTGRDARDCWRGQP
jgi:hypothetical protein